ncbi:MAG TPA: hypothetical protein ENK91_03350 [Bacteroidetes bacterium]|nr:hypothetical protein [Bacteroidota bacterium]
MAITFDKKALKKSMKYVKMGRTRYALRIAFFYSIFQAIFTPLFLFLINEDYSWTHYIEFAILLFVLNYVTMYIISSKDYKRMESLYYNSIEYFKENNPEFIADILEQNSDNDK